MTDPIHLETWGILDAVLDDRTNLSGRWIAEGIAWYARPAAPRETVVRPITGQAGGGGSADGLRTAKASKPRTAQKRTAKRTRNAVQKILDYLTEHPSDAILSTDTLYTKLNKQARLKVGRSSVGKALGIARVNGR